MVKPEVACVVDARAQVGEGAFWDHEEQTLFWVDIPRCRLHRFEPATGASRTLELGEPIGCAALRRGGGAVVALRSGFHFLDLDSGALTPIEDPEAGRPETRFNDGAVDPAGRLWAGTMAEAEPRPRVGRFYRLDSDLAWSTWFEPVHVSNGLAFSPDGRTMYYSDSHPEVRTIWACDYDLESGVPSGRRVFFDTRAVAGRPDGGTVDAEGCYWMAGVGGWQLVRLTPKGVIDRLVELPVERPTRPAFGGRDLDVLYVTSIGQSPTPGTEPRQPQAGGVFAVTGLGVTGVPQPRFAG
jgi:L-arabinonolactonase